MTRKEFLKSTLLSSAMPLVVGASSWSNSLKKHNSIQLLRHATLIIKLNGLTFLIDPMLSPKEAMDPIQNAGNTLRIPMTELPVSDKELRMLIKQTDAVIVTHTHRDHWDTAAQQLIPKNKQIFCQPEDEEKIKSQGFLNVKIIKESISWNDISIQRTRGQHGKGELGRKMGAVSGFILSSEKDSIYIAGDTIWCDEVAQVLTNYAPKMTIVNCGAPQYVTGGGPITMDIEDVISTHHALPSTQLIAVHMDTINHCTVTRKELKNALVKKDLLSNITVPKDGEIIHL